MDYKELIIKSFNIVWRHKWLWVFGLFASGVGGNYNFGSSSNLHTNTSKYPFRASSAQISNWVTNHLILIAILIATLLLLFFLIFILSIISQGALIGAAYELDKEEEISFGQAFGAGLHNFWSVAGLMLLIVLIVFVVLAIPAAAITALTARTAPLLILLFIIPLVLLLLPFFLALKVIGLLALRIIVIDGRGAIAAFRESIGLFWRRLGPTLITWLINIGLAIAFGLALVIVLLFLIVPTGIGAYFVFRSGFDLVKLSIFVFFGFTILAVVLTAVAAFGAYQSTYWTLAYRQLKRLDAAETSGD